MAKLINIIPAVVGGIAGKAGAGKGLIGAGIGLVAARIASRSVPGALLVGGAMVAKYLYDRKKAEMDGNTAANTAANTGATPPPARRASKH